MKPLSLIKPRRLKRGDRIGVVSPAGPVEPSDLQRGIGLVESSGYRVSVAPHVYSRKDYLAGEDEKRLEDLHAMFLDPDISAVFCARGGYGSLRLLAKLRFEEFRANPKIFVGYSDITSLLFAFYLRSEVVTFHGPMVRDLSKNGEKNWEALERVLSSPESFRLDLDARGILSPGRAAGPLIGGNLATICHLVGTPFLPDTKGSLLLLEEVGEPLYRVDRMLTHLLLSGRLDGIAGLVAGGFEGCGEEDKLRRLLLDRVGGLNVPIVMGLPIGHGARNRAFPMGLPAEIDTHRLTLEVI